MRSGVLTQALTLGAAHTLRDRNGKGEGMLVTREPALLTSGGMDVGSAGSIE